MIKKFLTFIFIIILVIIVLLVIGDFKFAKPVYDEDEKLGYGKFETVRIDPMTGEKIPKDEINTYSNDNLKLKVNDGEEISFKEIKNVRDQIKEQIKGAGRINDSEELRKLCDTLLTKYLNTGYKIEEDNLYINNKIVTDDINFESMVNEIVQKIYKEQIGE